MPPLSRFLLLAILFTDDVNGRGPVEHHHQIQLAGEDLAAKHLDPPSITSVLYMHADVSSPHLGSRANCALASKSAPVGENKNCPNLAVAANSQEHEKETHGSDFALSPTST